MSRPKALKERQHRQLDFLEEAGVVPPAAATDLFYTKFQICRTFVKEINVLTAHLVHSEGPESYCAPSNMSKVQLLTFYLKLTQKHWTLKVSYVVWGF